MQPLASGVPEIRLNMKPDIDKSRDWVSGGGIRLGIVNSWPAVGSGDGAGWYMRVRETLWGRRGLNGVKEFFRTLMSVSEQVEFLLWDVLFKGHVWEGRRRAQRRPYGLPRSGQGLSAKKLRWQDGGRCAKETKLFNDCAPERFRLIGPVLIIKVDVTERSRAGSVGGILIARSAILTLPVAETTGGITYIERHHRQ